MKMATNSLASLRSGSTTARFLSCSSLRNSIQIAKFRFQDGSMTADLSALHEKAELQKLDLPPLALDGIGGTRGATPGELGTAVLDAFTRSVKNVGKSAAKAQARTLLEDQIGGEEGKAAGQLLDKLF